MKTLKKEIYQIHPDMMSFITKVGKFHESFGMSRIGGQIIALLVIAEKPLSHEDIQRILGISRASISSNMKIVLSSGVEEVHIIGDRKTYYKFSDYDGIKGYKIRLNINIYFTELLEDCILAMKKNNMKINNMEIMKKSILNENKKIRDSINKSKKKVKSNV
jgi:DNA-binding transcriptional regulator GbsR (MarR family)